MLIMLEAALSNAVTVPLLALLVLAVSRFRARPALMHVLWLLVLVKLLAPPLVWVPLAGIPSFAVTASEKSTGQAGGDSTMVESEPFLRHRFAANAGPEPVWEEQATPEAVLDPAGSTLPIGAVATERTTPLSSRTGSPIPALATMHPLGPVPEGEVSTIRPVHDAVAGGAEAVRAGSASAVVPISRRAIAMIGTVWLAGSVAWMLMAAVPIVRFQRLLRFARPVAPELRAEVQQLSARLGLVRAPEVVLVPACISPLVWPVGRLRLVFPEGLFEGMTPEQRATLLVHELAHVRRRDHWVRWLELAATLAYWWHPVLWWARSRLRRAEEECCDAWVVQTWPERSHTYASALLAVVGFLSGSRNGAAGRFLPASGLGQLGALRRRLALIYEGSTAARLTKRGRVALAGLAIALLPLLPAFARIESSRASKNQQARANALDGASSSEPHGLVQRGPFSKDRLPIECEVLYASVSPDGRKVAYVGSYHDAIAGAQHGLYVVVLETGDVRRLLDTPGLKTRPAWSPDSRKLAIGNASGYRSRYPLVIVDAQTGEVDRTGVDGVGAAWSPDGRFIAMTAETQRGGSWSAGVPADGRIGVWDIASRQLTAASPAGFHVRDGVTGDFARSGALRPLWSPDGRWIAYEQITSTRIGNAESDLRQTWLVDRDGNQLRRVLDEAQAVRWSEDSRFLIAGDTQKQQRIEVSRLPLVAPDDWPKPPERLVAASKEADEVTARAAQFDAAPILERNRPWQNPELDHLQSVQFTHRMEPVRLDERFAWRRDGTAFMQVVHREDQRAAEEVGRLSLITPQLHRYFLRPDAKYPKRVDVTREEVADYVRDHLMGTRTSFVALDWGRNPASFETVGVRDEAERGQVVISLAPGRTRQRRRYDLNAGAMFDTTSWAYVHNLRVLRSELTVDAVSHRILREVDYDGDGNVRR